MTWNDFYWWCREVNVVLSVVALAFTVFRTTRMTVENTDWQWIMAFVLYALYIFMSGCVSAQLLVNHDEPGPTAPATTALHLATIYLGLRWRHIQVLITRTPPPKKRSRSRLR